MEASRLDLGQVSQEAGEHLVGATHHPSCAREQLVIVEAGQAVVG